MDAFERLITTLSRLPGIGRRSAERIAMELVRRPGDLVRDLIAALDGAQRDLLCCRRCGSITSAARDPCRLCADPGRDGTLLCVVEEPGDIVLLERSGGYRGRYHALMGKLSPMRGKGVDDLRIQLLMDRIEAEQFQEVILALSTDVEGDSTASFLADLLREKKVNVTRLAFGLPAGSGIGYSDPVTLARALKGRQSA